MKRRVTTDKSYYKMKKETASMRPRDFRGLIHHVLASLELQIVVQVGALPSMMECAPSDIGVADDALCGIGSKYQLLHDGDGQMQEVSQELCESSQGTSKHLGVLYCVIHLLTSQTPARIKESTQGVSCSRSPTPQVKSPCGV